MVANHPARERHAAALGDELREQAVAEIGGTDAGGIEGLQDFQRFLHVCEREAGLERDIGGRLGEEPAVIERLLTYTTKPSRVTPNFFQPTLTGRIRIMN